MNLFNYFSAYIRRSCTILAIGSIFTIFSCQATIPPFVVRHLGDGHSIVQLKTNNKYLLLPIEEAAPEARVNVTQNQNSVSTHQVRLAINNIDYYVPLDLTGFDISALAINVENAPDSALCWRSFELVNEFDTQNRESHRPVYHFAPLYGWMNDPNGMVYKDGIYHLFYQYNPYGSMWGNMHWGHATSTDLINWEHQPVAISPDDLGTIFSGSSVVDKNNTSGFGKDAIVAFYTSAGERQTQSVAYSTDNGKSFTKYEGNPILTSEAPDFRDPKVIWHEATKKWIMILAVGQEMQFFTSSNLKDWTYESSFGEGHGAHGGVWECPDLIEVPIEGTNDKEWVLLCNINPGGPFGGSATQYFIGDFDGKTFTNQSPELTKWMDYGKDHYATVTWSNAPDNRHIAIAWMSNWQYANQVPTQQFRSANSIPRDLTLVNDNGNIILKSAPSPEVEKLRGEAPKARSFKVNKDYNIDKLLDNNTGLFEIVMTIRNKDAEFIGFRLFNQQGEEVDFCYNLVEGNFSMDRSKSGEVSFSEDFPIATLAPIGKNDEISLRIFTDKSSLELFVNDGEYVMTNLVFPSSPYNRASFYAKGGSYEVTSFKVYPLELK